MDPLNRKMHAEITAIRLAVNNKLQILSIDTTASLIDGVTAKDIRDSIPLLMKDCESYEGFLLQDNILVTEPAIINCKQKLNAFENAELTELVPTFTAMRDFVKAQLDLATGNIAGIETAGTDTADKA